MTQTETACAKTGKCSTAPKFRPLGNRVLLRRLKSEEKLKGGILLPDTAKKKQEQAEVVAVGPGKADKAGTVAPMPVTVKQIVLIEQYSGQEVTLDGEDFVIVRADDILAIVER